MQPTPTLPPAFTATATPGAFQQAVLDRTNFYRTQNGLQPLRFNDILNRVAQSYAEDLARAGTITHTLNGTTPAGRIAMEGYNWSWAGENLACGYGTGTAVVDAWFNEPPDAEGRRGHRENILNPNYTEMGVGVASGGSCSPVTVQDLARPAGG